MTDPQHNAKNTGRGRPPAEHRFRTGNPGRPRGSRNRSALLQGLLADGDLETIVEAIIAKAKQGNLAAAKLVLDRVMPAPRTRPIELDLPAIGEWEVAGAIIAAFGAITRAAASGTITPSEAVEMVAVLEAQRSAIADLQPGRFRTQLTPEQIEAQQRPQLADLLTLWSTK
jgi:hypothetical protein